VSKTVACVLVSRDREFLGQSGPNAGGEGDQGNSVAPGPIWTPLIRSTMPPEKAESFGQDTPLGRAGQPAELAPTYVLLASDDGSYISGARIAVTGGRPIL
jgi:NAD(P)-dependent dehydrogenase (short-subunit alcohol dehydrogenase family)